MPLLYATNRATTTPAIIPITSKVITIPAAIPNPEFSWALLDSCESSGNIADIGVFKTSKVFITCRNHDGNTGVCSSSISSCDSDSVNGGGVQVVDGVGVAR